VNITTQIRLSCIIPTLGRGDVLLETIRMLLAQSYPAHEIIVVDQTPCHDPAVLGELEILERKRRFRWLKQTEANASKARNAGAAVAKGEVLVFLDDDIRIEQDFLAAHARNYRDPGVAAVAGQILKGNGDVVYHRTRESGNPELDWLYFPRNFGKRCPTTWMASGNFSIRRELFLKLGGMDERYFRGGQREESDFAFRFLRTGRRFQFDPDASILHLGIKVVPGGGSRPTGRYFGVWNHFVGHWYFIAGFATPRTFLPLAWDCIRGHVVTRVSLQNPVVFLCRLLMLAAAVPKGYWMRLENHLGQRTQGDPAPFSSACLFDR